MLILTSATLTKSYQWWSKTIQWANLCSNLFLSSENKSKSRSCTSRNMDEDVKFIFGRLKWGRLGIMSFICDYIVYMGWVLRIPLPLHIGNASIWIFLLFLFSILKYRGDDKWFQQEISTYNLLQLAFHFFDDDIL